MPQQGSKVYKFRVPPDVEREMLAQIAQRNYHTQDDEWTVSGFLLKAVKEKLAHMRRARRSKRQPNAVFYHGKGELAANQPKRRGKEAKRATQPELFA